jgi:hypothetical protein
MKEGRRGRRRPMKVLVGGRRGGGGGTGPFPTPRARRRGRRRARGTPAGPAARGVFSALNILI